VVGEMTLDDSDEKSGKKNQYDETDEMKQEVNSKGNAIGLQYNTIQDEAICSARH